MFQYSATYKRNYDGDTCTLAIDLGFGISICHPVRLLGLDTAELKTGDHKELAKRARDWLRDKLINRELIVTTCKVSGTGEKTNTVESLPTFLSRGKQPPCLTK